MRLTAVALAALVLAGCGSDITREPPPALEQQVHFGGGVFRYECARCHGAGRSAPRLSDEQLSVRFDDAAAMYAFVSRRMPYDKPGALPDDDYWAVVAYLLDRSELLKLRDDRTLGPETASGVAIERVKDER